MDPNLLLQIDGGVQLTSNKKFLTVVPVASNFPALLMPWSPLRYIEGPPVAAQSQHF